MIVNRTFKAHSNLLTRMADTLGVDLVAALRHGTVEPREMTDHVYRCLSCSSPRYLSHLYKRAYRHRRKIRAMLLPQQTDP